jgi:hypothetical protein
MRLAQSLYRDTKIAIDNGKGDKRKMVEIHEGMRQGCPSSTIFFNVYVDNTARQWQNNLTNHFRKNQNVIDTLYLLMYRQQLLDQKTFSVHYTNSM